MASKKDLSERDIYLRNGYFPKAVEFQTKTKTLKLGAITYGFFDATQFKYINEVIDDDSYLWLKKGDILIQRSNSIDMAGIYDGKDNNFIYPDLIMKVKCSQYSSKYFLQKSLVSAFTRDYFKKNASGSQKDMPKINQPIVANTLVPLPSYKEQKEIVKKIETLFKICDKLETQINSSKTNSQTLMQSVLKEAFENNA